MNVSVLLSSGDVDDWEDAADAVDDRGSLVVLAHIEGDEVPGNIKTMQVREPIDNGPGVELGEKSQIFQVCAIYAPGMWMKVEFE